MYDARVFKIMIASPGDVAKERQILRKIIHDWNDLNSEHRQVVLMPIGWETHSYPEMGAPPQEIINRQVLRNCDALIGVLWTRIGTPTGEFASGTAEEIESHIESGKPTMIYFSDQPIVPSSVDQDQYSEVTRFKEACRTRGIIETYDSLSQFEEKVTRQLNQLLIKNEYFSSGLEALPSAPISRPEDEVWAQLALEAQELLLGAVDDPDGTILKTLSHDGLAVQTNGRQFVEDRQDPRSRTKWEGAVQELCVAGLVEERGQRGEVFQITNFGFSVADSGKVLGV